MTAMFIGLVSAYIGSYIGGFVSGNGMFSFSWKFPAADRRSSFRLRHGRLCLSGGEKEHGLAGELSIAGSMLIGMAAAVVVKLFI